MDLAGLGVRAVDLAKRSKVVAVVLAVVVAAEAESEVEAEAAKVAMAAT